MTPQFDIEKEKNLIEVEADRLDKKAGIGSQNFDHLGNGTV